MKAILTYHSIDDTGSVISVTEGTFRTHMRWLARSNISVVPLDQLEALPADTDAVSITFDDGFVNFAELAWPILRAHGFPATLFVVTDCAGKSNLWESNGELSVPQLRLLDWPSLGRLVEEGVTLGSHSRSHRHLRRTRGRTLIDEVELAAARIRSETGQRPAAFAYPFGDYDTEVVGVVGAVHSSACTTQFRCLDRIEDPLRLPRLDSYYFRRPGRLERLGSAAFRRYLWFRRSGRRLRRVFSAGGAA
jgi:peptidoglycan/xylan/chitin deacetylase (PgdA/CDA1 family)